MKDWLRRHVWENTALWILVFVVILSVGMARADPVRGLSLVLLGAFGLGYEVGIARMKLGGS